MLETPERAPDAFTAQVPASFSPAPFSDDDTISDNSFDASSGHFAFTPKRPGKLPRAWERKLATPFAPRTDTQKIWKRVPLQDKPTNGTVELRASGNGDVDARGVKRVRLTAPIAGNGKENYANTQWDKQADDAKRKVPKDIQNTLQSSRNSLSPLRNDSTFEILNDPPPPRALKLEADHVIRRLEEMQEAEELDENNIMSDIGSLNTNAPENTLLQQPPQTTTLGDEETQAACSSEEAASEDDDATTPSTNGFFTDSIIFDDQYSESEIDEDPIAEDVTPQSQSGEPGSDILIEDSRNIFPAPDTSILALFQNDEARDLSQESSDTSVGSLGLDELQSQIPEEIGVGNSETVEPEQAAGNSISEIMEDVMPLHHFETIPDLLQNTESVQKHAGVQAEVDPASPSEEDLGAEAIVPEGTTEPAETPSLPETSVAHTQATIRPVTHPQGSLDQVSDDETAATTAQPDIMVFGGANDSLSNQLFTPQAPILSRPDAPPSDDTAYLNDFLTRARAKKVAQAASSTEKMDPLASSPAKNTRQAIANLSTKPVSPSAATEPELRPGKILEDTMIDDQATSPCRRSSRPRFPKPLKSIAPAIPNTIPVRRSNGTEFIFLPRSEAMQISLDTRTNTQRNKGEAVPPVVRLESLSTGEISPIKERKKSSKTKKMVKWDEKLTQEQLEAVLENQALILETKPDEQATMEAKAKSEVERSEKREKNARKSVKRLGTVNGTPAPKKRAMTATALPVPTRTLRARTKA